MIDGHGRARTHQLPGAIMKICRHEPRTIMQIIARTNSTQQAVRAWCSALYDDGLLDRVGVPVAGNNKPAAAYVVATHWKDGS